MEKKRVKGCSSPSRWLLSGFFLLASLCWIAPADGNNAGAFLSEAAPTSLQDPPEEPTPDPAEIPPEESSEESFWDIFESGETDAGEVRTEEKSEGSIEEDPGGEDGWVDMEPELIEVVRCDDPAPKRVSSQSRSCSGNGDAPCARWDPPQSSLCRARADRLPEVDVDYQYFGQVDCRSSHREEEVTQIVIHNGDHARGNNHNWQCRKSAAHYTIDRDGTLYQHIGEERAAWHAKQVNQSSIGIELQILRGYGSSCNSLTGAPLTRAARQEGVEEGDIVRELCEPTVEQYLALDELIEDIRSRHPIAEDGVVGHCEVDRPGGHGDPRAFDWELLGLSNRDKLAFVESHDTACTWYHLMEDSFAPDGVSLDDGEPSLESLLE
ncbi:MAG: N-acetylmuramoyl-L-alanine amidase [Deltaproteobacteria bacterium]|nr:N-acetylmuramoyl-L-alanine amidase [Deltaproteobacteria bacterium]